MPRTTCVTTLLLTLLLILAQPTSAQWTTQSPIPTDLAIHGIAAPTADRVFVATDDDSFDDGGALFESADGGVTWTQRNVPFSKGDPLNGIFFYDDQHGWVFGNGNYRTTDGGTTWTQLPNLGSLYFMEFYTLNFGYTSTNGESWISLNGGLDWETTPNGLFAFDFADDQTGLGASTDGIYRTTDGGATFTLVQAGEASAVAFLSPTLAVGIVDDTFVRSTDGGQTWTSGDTAEARNALEVVSEDVIIAWGRSGFFPNDDSRLLRSADGGLTWTDLGPVIGEGTGGFSVLSATTVVASDGFGNAFLSTDAGLTWTQTFASPSIRPSFFNQVRPVFADALTGYLGYGNGYVVKTTDGGATWNQVSSGYGASLNGIDRFPDGRLMAVGEAGTLLTYTGVDGNPWVRQMPPTSIALSAVQTLDDQSVVVADEDGRVYRSADGGATWTAGAAVPLSLDARDLHFTTLLDGWVIGSSFGLGALHHTTDGGDTWTAVEDFRGSYVAVDFEGTNGWAANVGGRYYRSIDNGATWTQEELPDENGFLGVGDMDFYDASIGYAVGNFGYAARSDDGGLTWEILPTPNADDTFTDIYLIGPNELWLSTNQDRAYYTATGGQNWAVLDIGSEGFQSFSAIAASPEGDAWTVGFQGYIEHFMGPPPPPVNRPPEAAFTFEATRLTIDFTDMSDDPDGFIVSYAWDFGDGATSTEQNPSHTYAEEGTYIARLTVTDDDGDTGSAGAIVTVDPGPGGTFGDFTEVTPFEVYFVTPQDEDFWVATTAPADYDGDGDLDVAVLGFYVVYNESVEELLLLFRNDGEGLNDEWNFTYIEVPLGNLVSGASDLAWADIDGDGDQDLAVGSEGETVLYRNDAGILTPTDTVLPGYYEDNDQADFDLNSISWADYDNDGDQDLLLPSVFDFDTFQYRTVLLRNDGANGTGGWVFTDVEAALAPTGHAQSVWADEDGDEDLDLLLVHLAPLTDDGFIRRYRNDGGTFVGEDILGNLTIEHGEADWGDYDADGDYDILVAGHIKEADGTFDVVLRIYRNDAGTYTPFEVIESPRAEGWIDLTAASWADYDADGDMDILLTGTYNSGEQIDGRAKIYGNEGGVFTDTGNDLPAPRASGSRGGTFSWLDLDGEGDLDYFIAGEYFVPGGNGLVEAQMHVYRNDVPAIDLAPTAPTDLEAIVEESAGVEKGAGLGLGAIVKEGAGLEASTATVSLSWTASQDDHTPPVALTYDLMVREQGTTVVDVRRLPEPGNISTGTNWTLTGLDPGTYVWSVRAVDTAFNGSPEAEGTFTIGDPPATLTMNAEPVGSTVIPPEGGTLVIDLTLTNLASTSRQVQIWTSIISSGLAISRSGALVMNVTLEPNGTFTKQIMQLIPERASPGTYSYVAFAGRYPDVEASDRFTFTKTFGAAAKGQNGVQTWDVLDANGQPLNQMLIADNSTLKQDASQTPTDFALESAYPNPFNPQTTIRYALPETSPVRLMVFDVLGREVTRLFDGTQSAGIHTVSFDATGLPSGSYFVHMQAGAFTRTLSIVLLQ